MLKRVRPGVNRLDVPQVRVRALDEEDFHIMHLPRHFWGSAVSDLPEETRAREKVEQFIASVDDVMRRGEPTLFLFTGPPVTGKETAATLMLRCAREHGYTSFYLDAAEIQSRWIEDSVTNDEELTFAERAHLTEALVLSGLGLEQRSEFAQVELLRLIRHRQYNGLLTIVTTPLRGEEITTLYNPELLALLRLKAVEIKTPLKLDNIF